MRVPTILLVEDAEVVRKSAARCLRRRGYVVIEASNAAQALELLAANVGKIDLLLTDIVLPVMGGAELVEEARRRQPSVGIAYMTGHLGISARCETALDETAPLLIKPFTPNLLEERVREALARAGWTANGPSFGAH
jgi:two-component system, cell cycle sensor histidine kinase and response regulator CckA